MSGHTSCPRKPLEKLVGKLVFASRVCRWGFLFVQSLLDALYPSLGQFCPRRIDGVWHDLNFWLAALGPNFYTWMGVKQFMLHTKNIHADPSNFGLHIYSDANKTFGVGGILGSGEIYSARWDRDVSPEHICALELEALLWNLRHWQHEFHNTYVLAWLDNVQAVHAVNKEASRIQVLRDTLLQIALLGLKLGFDLRARHVKGTLNPADAPSRGVVSTRTQDFTFLDFAGYNSPPASVDCCADALGTNVQPGCTEWFSLARPVQENVHSLAGKVLWANIPFTALDSILDSVVAAWHLNANTIATVVVPEWPTAAWYRKYLRRKQPVFRLLHRYPVGSLVFSFSDSGSPAPPVKFPILVMRIGSTRV